MKTSKLYAPRTGFGRLAGDMIRRYYVHDVARDSAALTYYLLFAIFPLLIFVSTLLGVLELDIASITAVLRPFSRRMWWTSSAHIWSMWPPTRAASCCGSAWFFPSGSPCASTGCLMHSLRKAFGRSAPENILLGQLRTLLFTIWMIFVIGLTLALVVVGRRALYFLSGFLPLSETFISVWGYLRFIILGLVMATSLGILYQLGAGAAPPPAGGTARRRQLSGGMAAAEHGLFLLCGKYGPVCAAVRLHRHHRGGTAVAVYVGAGPDTGRGAVRVPDPSKETCRALIGRGGGSMKIIIVGCGKVGYAIAGQLTQEKHDIVMVDNEIAHLSRADSTMDVMCVHGSGASISVLMDAGRPLGGSGHRRHRRG